MQQARRWLGDLPPAVARRIAWDNGAALFGLQRLQRLSKATGSSASAAKMNDLQPWPARVERRCNAEMAILATCGSRRESFEDPAMRTALRSPSPARTSPVPLPRPRQRCLRQVVECPRRAVARTMESVVSRPTASARRRASAGPPAARRASTPRPSTSPPPWPRRRGRCTCSATPTAARSRCRWRCAGPSGWRG